MIKAFQDACGEAIYDYYKGKLSFEIIERDDGFFDVSGGPELYFSEPENWLIDQKKSMKYAHGKVLDIGAGAGRFSLYLKKKDFDVTAVDISPKAVETCRLRGVKKVFVMPIEKLDFQNKFDTVLLQGNNFGLMKNLRNAKKILKKLLKITNEKAVIIAQSADPHTTIDDDYILYQKNNVKNGRMPGQIKIRVRYKKLATGWFDFLYVSKSEMSEILKDTGWKINKIIDSEFASYTAIIKKI